MFFRKSARITDDLIGKDERVCICSARIAEFLQPAACGQAKEEPLSRALASLAGRRNPKQDEVGSEETEPGKDGAGGS